MHELASRLATAVKIPLMFDSTEWEKMEAGLEHAGGKSLLNSTNYEDGEERFLKVLDLAKRYGAGVVVGLIDEDGMARTAADKLKIAHRAYKQAVETGIESHDIFFDPLALPISTGIEEDRKNADETINAIKQIEVRNAGREHHFGSVEHLIRTQSGGSRRAQLSVSARLRRGRNELGDRQRVQDLAIDEIQSSTRSM